MFFSMGGRRGTRIRALERRAYAHLRAQDEEQSRIAALMTECCFDAGHKIMLQGASAAPHFSLPSATPLCSLPCCVILSACLPV